MTTSDNLVTRMAHEAHALVCDVCRTLHAVKGAVDYVENMTGERYGREEVARALSYANMARLNLGMAKKGITGGDYDVYPYGKEESDKRFTAYVSMLKASYGDELETVTGVNVDKISDTDMALASDLLALVKETGVSLDWLMGGEA